MKTLILTLFSATASLAQVSFNTSVTTDYIARGTSQSLGEPAYQFGIDILSKSGFYTGIWTSNVDFGDGTDQEIDLWLGYSKNYKGIDFGFCGLLYAYTNDPVSYEMLDFKVSAAKTYKSLTTNIAAAYTPDYFNVSGVSWWVETNLVYKLNKYCSISGGIGTQIISRGGTYGTFNIGTTFQLHEKATLDFRYADTNEHQLGKAYESTFAATFKISF